MIGYLHQIVIAHGVQIVAQPIPVPPRKTKEQIELERLERLEKAFKYTRYCVQCGKKFYTNKQNRVLCGDWVCEDKQRFEQRKENYKKGKQK